MITVWKQEPSPWEVHQIQSMTPWDEDKTIVIPPSIPALNSCLGRPSRLIAFVRDTGLVSLDAMPALQFPVMLRGLSDRP
ncbi:hypothetical protein BgiMline_003055 [Biomphalaria glabrata]|nr:hypothetical protein BgiMline_011628 [Biomphalaria glabrata]